MSSDSEPKVEVLTAEIRVLQVGSKPVTLSAYRQLDHVEPGEITPFGRVRDRDTNADTIEVVGADASGTLARSRVRRTPHRCDGNPGGHRLIEDCGEIARLTALAAGHGAHDPEWERVWSHKHTWYTYTPDERTWEAWRVLPLIVLAGLR